MSDAITIFLFVLVVLATIDARIANKRIDILVECMNLRDKASP